ncbi:ATP-dependent Clp protease ATP-binding subunit [Flavobacterium aquariorum]|uniref:ATP-dependent Clp protease ATP-binding subunit n=1 Tax=Flavobacterium aquariorum TaxID=2217670 RepID=A0A2W7VNL7_9FLAO|nr:ATP-dependent Clp protease ATP-binding subunit [Flavobacterium aquariorum]PZX93692.1 ATP-dependent Clp protease ATP-binding subunit [Flavobacterium aquariorum]
MEEGKNIFSRELIDAFEIAKKIAKNNSNPFYAGSHLLKAILNRDFSLLKQLEILGKDVYYLEEWAEVRMENEPKTNNVLNAEPDDVIDAIVNEAELVREMFNEEEISLFAIMVALSSPGVGFNFDQMKTYPISRNELLDEQIISPQESGNFSNKEVKKGFLGKYCFHKNSEKNKKHRIAIGREEELNTMKEILCRFSKPNVLIIGDRGIGKSTLIDNLVLNVIQNQVPDVLHKVQLFELDLSSLIAGASYKGEIEDRLRNCIQELNQYPKAILIIEEIHTLLDKNGGDSGVSNVLKAELAKGLTIIATSTIEEYSKRIEKEQGLAGMFEILKLQETDDDTMFRMVKESIQVYQEHHKIKIDDETISESIRLSRRYLKEKSLPESALNLIDHTMSVLKTSGESFLKEKQLLVAKLEILKVNEKDLSEEQLFKEANWFMQDLIKKTTFLMVVDEQNSVVFENSKFLLQHIESLINTLEEKALDKRVHIEAFDLSLVIAQKTGIPVGKLKEEEKNKLNSIEEVLSQRVIGQDHCIATVAGSILESRSGLSKAGQPIASFFFLGPTGTGKTELAKSLAEFLFQDENAIIRFDMSEFKEEHSAALLYGAPPGYVGYEEGGLLVNKIRQKPYSIVLFDEIEKAHTSVYDVFLQIMDEGKLHDRLGKEGDFSNAIVLFTSNIGADHIVESFGRNVVPTSTSLMEIMGGFFRPEFLGRLTEIVPFAPISKENALKIFEVHLKKEFVDLLKNISITVDIPMEVKMHLAESGYNAKYGARPIKSIIRSHLRRPLAKKIISGEVQEGDRMTVSIENGEVKWMKELVLVD